MIIIIMINDDHHHYSWSSLLMIIIINEHHHYYYYWWWWWSSSSSWTTSLKDLKFNRQANQQKNNNIEFRNLFIFIHILSYTTAKTLTILPSFWANHFTKPSRPAQFAHRSLTHLAQHAQSLTAHVKHRETMQISWDLTWSFHQLDSSLICLILRDQRLGIRTSFRQ